MSPRRYDRRRRDEAMAATRARIVDAIVELHAELGPSRTTYALIAKRADVAVPTVYKHFPEVAGMFAACIGHVSAQLPSLTAEVFAQVPDVAGRVTALASALCERHQHFAPWLRWSLHEAHLLPELGALIMRMGERQRRLIREALTPGQDPRATLVAMLDALLSFETWQKLAIENGLAPREASKAVAQAARAIIAAEATPVRRTHTPKRPATTMKSRT